MVYFKARIVTLFLWVPYSPLNQKNINGAMCLFQNSISIFTQLSFCHVDIPILMLKHFYNNQVGKQYLELPWKYLKVSGITLKIVKSRMHISEYILFCQHILLT